MIARKIGAPIRPRKKKRSDNVTNEGGGVLVGLLGGGVFVLLGGYAERIIIGSKSPGLQFLNQGGADQR